MELLARVDITQEARNIFEVGRYCQFVQREHKLWHRLLRVISRKYSERYAREKMDMLYKAQVAYVQSMILKATEPDWVER